MKIVAMHSHLNGHEWLLVHEKLIWKEIDSIIKGVDAKAHKTKISKERTMKGKALFAPKELNKVFGRHFEDAGWNESRTSYWVGRNRSGTPGCWWLGGCVPFQFV